MEKRISFKETAPLGIPLYLWVIILAITILSMATGVLGTDFGSTLFWMTIIGGVVIGIGNRIPVVKDYLGGGPLVLLILGSFITWAGLLPEKYVQAANDFMAGFNVQAFFLTLLIVGSVMAIDRKTLIRSLIGYIPCILGGLIAAAVFGIIVGKLFGMSVGQSLMEYVMPIMGGGSAAGALPMSAIYGEVTGGDTNAYYGTAMSTLMLANVMCIFFAVGLDTLGKKIPALTGNGSELMKRPADADEVPVDDYSDIKTNPQDVGNGLVIMLLCWVGAGLMSGLVLPKIFGIPIHQYAYLVILAVLVNVTNILPRNIRKSIGTVNRYIVSALSPAVFAGMAISLLDFQSFIDALSVQTLIVDFFIIVGAIIGSALVGRLVGYYPIDAAVTGGLCMANMGGSGDMVVLAAGHRMGLMTYASISSRIGGAIVLAISGVVFGLFG